MRLTATAPVNGSHQRPAAAQRHQAHRPAQREVDDARPLEDIRAAVRKGEHVDPSKAPLGAYLEEWLGGLRLAPSTVASYRKNVRLHIAPHLGAVPLSSLTTARINTLYRQLERRPGSDAAESLSGIYRRPTGTARNRRPGVPVGAWRRAAAGRQGGGRRGRWRG